MGWALLRCGQRSCATCSTTQLMVGCLRNVLYVKTVPDDVIVIRMLQNSHEVLSHGGCNRSWTGWLARLCSPRRLTARGLQITIVCEIAGCPTAVPSKTWRGARHPFSHFWAWRTACVLPIQVPVLPIHVAAKYRQMFLHVSPCNHSLPSHHKNDYYHTPSSPVVLLDRPCGNAGL
jgi:hypothetical protein